MRKRIAFFLLLGGLGAASMAIAQRPGGPGGGQGPETKSADADDLVAQMMVFDKDKDGKLLRSELTDERLFRLFDRADTDKDGAVTKAELTALADREHVERRGGPGGFGGPPGGFGGPGGPGGPGGGMMFRPGDILPPMFQQMLRLSSDQKSQVEALQKEVDAKLMKILTEEQSQQFKDMRSRGPGGGPPGGGRRGGPGGGPPGGPGGGPPGGRPD